MTEEIEEVAVEVVEEERAPDQLTLNPGKRLIAAMETLEREIGGRPQLAEVLSFGEVSERLRIVGDMLADPENDGHSLAWVCAASRVSVREFLDYLRTSLGARAQIASLVRVADKLPHVAQSVLNGAVDRAEDCWQCGGTGNVEGKKKKPVACSNCRGRGKFHISGDFDRQKLALEMGGMLKGGGGGININVDRSQRTLNIAAGADVLTHFLAASDKVLYGAPAEPPPALLPPTPTGLHPPQE